MSRTKCSAHGRVDNLEEGLLLFASHKKADPNPLKISLLSTRMMGNPGKIGGPVHSRGRLGFTEAGLASLFGARLGVPGRAATYQLPAHPARQPPRPARCPESAQCRVAFDGASGLCFYTGMVSPTPPQTHGRTVGLGEAGVIEDRWANHIRSRLNQAYSQQCGAFCSGVSETAFSGG